MGKELHKKSYTVSEFYTILCKGLRTFPFLRKNKKNKKMSNHFIERIMLVTSIYSASCAWISNYQDISRESFFETILPFLMGAISKL